MRQLFEEDERRNASSDLKKTGAMIREREGGTQPRDLSKSGESRLERIVSDLKKVNGREWEDITWRQAGYVAASLTVFGLLIFGIQSLIFASQPGTPTRSLLVVMFGVICPLLVDASVKDWRSRLRLLAAFATSMAIIGFFFLTVAGDRTTFHPIFIGMTVGIYVIVWGSGEIARRKKRG